MNGWAGFWIALAISYGIESWRSLRKKELQGKYPKLEFKWYE